MSGKTSFNLCLWSQILLSRKAIDSAVCTGATINSTISRSIRTCQARSTGGTRCPTKNGRNRKRLQFPFALAPMLPLDMKAGGTMCGRFVLSVHLNGNFSVNSLKLLRVKNVLEIKWTSIDIVPALLVIYLQTDHEQYQVGTQYWCWNGKDVQTKHTALLHNSKTFLSLLLTCHAVTFTFTHLETSKLTSFSWISVYFAVQNLHTYPPEKLSTKPAIPCAPRLSAMTVCTVP